MGVYHKTVITRSKPSAPARWIYDNIGFDANEALDYGCGKAEGYLKHNHHKHWGILPELYDPAVVPFTRLPEGTYDGVISFDAATKSPICFSLLIKLRVII